MANKVYTQPREREFAEMLDASQVDTYLEAVQSQYSNPKAKETLGVGNDKVSKSNDGCFSGCSPFLALQLLHQNSQQKGTYPNGTLPMTRPQIERILQDNPDYLSGRYADLGIALWEASETYDPNKHLHTGLIQQLKDKGISVGSGKIIYFSGLEKPNESGESAYGLTLSLKDIRGKELSENGHIVDVEGFSWRFKKGKGLARAYYYGSGWSCNVGPLEGSGRDGRVVGGGVEATTDDMYSAERIKEALNETNFGGAINSVFGYLESHK